METIESLRAERNDLANQLRLMEKDRDKWLGWFNRAAAQRDELQKEVEDLMLNRKTRGAA